MALTIGVLALQGDFREHLATLDACGVRTRAVKSAAQLSQCDALVLPGGESTTIDKLARAFDLRDPIVSAIAGGMPVYGSCAGMILLADEVADGTADQQTFGGIDMTVRRNAFGRQVDSFEEDLTIAGVAGPPLRAVFIRAPAVERVGSGVEVLATTSAEQSPDRIVAVRSGNLLATSFHPEVTGDHRIHELFIRIATKEQ
ncbi:pyridoxal 5'-phosphate synthase glutaminase subunit PdxT [Rarobacter faecitabidus]|uniref:pyridoxal 5'-phosphate synthase glutaminase subunit PdxT n=1 Tax=Rarobacter faecitabidus TaxID=13243 RepID=UPI00114F8401|nr:pyridoxal 5'-phosphate synthase glutaminase subunit PdxT [Rarobacter faecitabidus]